MNKITRRQAIEAASGIAVLGIAAEVLGKDRGNEKQENVMKLRSQACQVKVLNSAPGEVIEYGGATFNYDSGAPSYDPYNLPTNGLKEMNIANGEAGYLFGKPDRCCKTITVILTWTHGSGSVDIPDPGAGYCWSTPEVELAPAYRYRHDSKDSNRFLEVLITDPASGNRKRLPITLSDEAKKVIGSTK
jgi:hypothetical protein